MPTPVSPIRPTLRPLATAANAAGTVTVRAGDTLSAIAQRTLGDSRRWKEIYELNKAAIGPDAHRIRVGMVLRTSGAPVTPAPQPGPAPQPKPPAEADTDGDGLIDRYDAAPADARDRRWNQAAQKAFSEFAPAQADKLKGQGIEIDCADFAAKLLKDFCDTFKLPNPLEKVSKWSVYTAQRTGGLPNVQGDNYVLSGIRADNLAKDFTKDIPDADGNGRAGWDRETGEVDVKDLRAGDILFYDWDGDGKVNHTVNVLGVAEDGSVTVAFGTYDNVKSDGGPVRWENLDLSPIQKQVLVPGTPEYEEKLGPGNCLWGVRRYGWMAEA
jgi:hypothetical protein